MIQRAARRSLLVVGLTGAILAPTVALAQPDDPAAEPPVTSTEKAARAAEPGTPDAAPAPVPYNSFSGGSITINDDGPASPYPSIANVSGLTGSVTKVEVTVRLSHLWAEDIEMMLVGPQGQNVILMSDAGGSATLANTQLTFRDAAATTLPSTGTIASGAYRPTNVGTLGSVGPFPAPAPTPSGSTSLSTFNGTAPNGQWRLFVVDDAYLISGQVHAWSVAVTTNATSSGGRMFNSVAPARLFDTRSGQGGVPATRIRSGMQLTVKVTGKHGVPGSGVAAVALNVTATGATGSGFITVYPCGTLPNASNVNYRANQTVPNAVIAPVSAQGNVCFYAERSTHLIADISGWFSKTAAGFTSLTPARLFDTRSGLGGVPARRIPSGQHLTVRVTGKHGVPNSGVSAVALNVTATGAVGAGFITVYPCGGRPNASNINYAASATVPNAVIAPVSTQGNVCFYAETATHLIADMSGWFSTAASSFRGLVPNRQADTRSDTWSGAAEPLAAPARIEPAPEGRTGPASLHRPSPDDPPTPSPYITNGSPISISQAPWQVHMIADHPDGMWSCGGALIHPRWVLTAAHCTEDLYPEEVYLHIGVTYTNQMTLGNAHRVRRIINHPQYDPYYADNDIALMELVAPATAGATISPNFNSSQPVLGTPGLVSGWGRLYGNGPSPDQLRAATVFVQAGPGSGSCGGWGPNYLSHMHICAQAGAGTGACQGDSGGPLATQAGGQWRLIGLVSWGHRDCLNTTTFPTVFTRVSSYGNWILQYVPDPRKIQGSRIVEVQVTGRGGVPASGVGGVSLNLTVTSTEGSGYATVYPCGAVPSTSTINYTNGQTRANAVISPVSASGKVCVYSSNRTHALVDVNGWFPT